ncbi:MAG: NADH-quinone oxidoreductase subunit I [bacterium]
MNRMQSIATEGARSGDRPGNVDRRRGSGLGFTLGEILRGFWSLISGMGVTIEQFFKPNVTLHYPYESLKMTPLFRGHIELLKDKETGLTLCTSCQLCAKACPSFCIKVEGVKPEGAKRKFANLYSLDFTKCSLCGACVEVCPFDAIRFSRDYNLASTNASDYVMDLYKTMKEIEVPKKPEAPKPPVKPPAPEKAP